MNSTIREMKKEEATLVRQIGKPSFGLVEQLLFPQPQNALLEVRDGEIVGAATYRIFSAKDHQKVGYVETAYVKKGYEGKGIGSKIYSEITDFLKAQGCSTITAIVRDDNVASWKLLENNDYHITTFFQMLTCYGFLGAVRVWFYSMFCVGVGHHLWSTMPPKPNSSTSQIIFCLLLNLLVLLPNLFGSTLNSFAIGASAVLVLLSVSILGGMVATLFSKEKWVYRVARGGILISVIVAALGSVFPVVGRFYPKEYKNTKTFKRSMGIEGFFEWLSVLIIVIVAAIWTEQSAFWNSILSAGTIILLYRALPIYPFECFGGKRIWDYNKALSILTIIISAVLLFVW